MFDFDEETFKTLSKSKEKQVTKEAIEAFSIESPLDFDGFKPQTKSEPFDFDFFKE